MAWIESHTVLIRHRKLRDLARDLRIRPSYAMGHLHALWHAAMEQREDGDLSDWSDGFIADSSDFPGDAPQYVRLLQEHRWLDGKIVHDWIDYAGPFLIKRYSTSNRPLLVEIWKKHGREYGSERLASGKRVTSERLVSLPNPPDLPNLPNQPTHQGRGGGSPPTTAGGKGFPTTVDDAVAQCALVAVAVDFVTHCFDKGASRGGADAKGCAITDFPAYVRTEWRYQQDRKGRESNSQGSFRNGKQQIIPKPDAKF